MTISKQALREEFRYMQVHYSDPADRARQVIYIAAEALLDDLEIKEEQRANWFQMAQKLGEDLDAAEKRNAEQREYYEGVIADGSKRIAELEARTVILPEPIIVLHRRDFTDAHREIYAYPEAEVNAALADAVIGVNGE
ncbi:ead/Ea22-like family protein [Salmonella enterica]|nr:ead/Ea22-like family protein [Salmonella enterica]EBM8467920.1 ead/Ea22-like family protein [Salmonella enterica subsp. enterica serovar Schwarzengrund]EBO2645902.1 ead/Ea22-like family protein [Salmonella enterica subsp. enterica serovar Schwarzengrund]ECJ2887389.1 ead/Ea22-like family protein [Salmonella enterica]ECT8698992.1 ead/Ea22-like family protein [Salmonella enterica subsp. enterica serovar Schwarzengrund]